MALFDKLAEKLGFSSEEYDDELEEENDDEFAERDFDDFEKEPAPKRQRGSEEAPRMRSGERTMEKSMNTQVTADIRKDKRSRTQYVATEGTTAGAPIVFQRPQNLTEARGVCAYLQKGSPVLVNMEGMDLTNAQRITDFLCGCCAALNGRIEAVSDRIYIIAPYGIEFAGEIDALDSAASSYASAFGDDFE